MEASGFGNGVVCVVGVFEPGAVVELVEREEGSTRSEGGTVYGRRAADEHREVGFDGLAVGAKFFAVGYTAGRRLELPVVAVDPSVTVTLVQPAVQPNPTTVGLQEQSVVVQPPAAPAEPVESGLPEGVLSPVLTPDEPESKPEDPTSETVLPDVPVEPAPEPPAATEPVVETPAPTEAVTPQTEPVVEPVSEPATPDASAVLADPVAEAQETTLEELRHSQLVSQAEGLLVAGAGSLTDEELRQRITELGQTPIA